MQREEKQLESSIEALIQRTQDVKNSITTFLLKLEHEYETLNWPTVLDNFALVSGQISTLNRLIKNEKMPLLRNQVCLPLVLSPERDQELEKLTEGRVVAFNHDVAPDYLRTKPEPTVEEKMQHFAQRAGNIMPDALQKQIHTANKVSNNLIDMISSARDERENEMNQKSQQPQMSSQNDTQLLIAVTSFGKGLKRRMESPSQPQRPPSAGHAQGGQPQQQQGFPFPGRGYTGQTQNQMGKVQSMIKTNIKAASNVHPYSRP